MIELGNRLLPSSCPPAGRISVYFEQRLSELGYDAGRDWVHIPAPVANAWVFNSGCPPCTAKWLVQSVKAGKVAFLVLNPSRRGGRGFLWGKGDRSPVRYDLLDRIAAQAEPQPRPTPPTPPEFDFSDL